MFQDMTAHWFVKNPHIQSNAFGTKWSYSTDREG